MEMTFMQSALFVATILVIFLAALVSLHPFGNWISKRMDEWPNRPMNNLEKRARWAAQYYMREPALPNEWTWKWRVVDNLEVVKEQDNEN